jgi:hypothetical protein
LTQQLTTLKRIDQEATKAAAPALHRRGASELRRPVANRLAVPGVSGSQRSNPSSPRALSPVQLVDRPLPARPA